METWSSSQEKSVDFLLQKNVLNEHIIWYEIQDETGKMEVLVYGRLTKVNCEEGDKLKLICFELSAEPRQLRSVIHSFIKVGTSGEHRFSNIEVFQKTRLTVLSIILSFFKEGDV